MNEVLNISPSVNAEGKKNQKDKSNVVRANITIDRAQYELLCDLGLVDPTKRKTGINKAIRKGLDLLIDYRWEIVKHVRRAK